MPKRNKDDAPRLQKITLKVLREGLADNTLEVKQLGEQMERLRTHNREKSELEEKYKFTKDRLGDVERNFIREQARAEILHAVVDRLLGVEKNFLTRKPGVDFEAPSAPVPQGGRCGACGRF